jgi:hypothetical protein
VRVRDDAVIRKCWIIFFSFWYAISAFAETGLTLTVPLISKDPNNLNGYKAALWYQPPSLIWPHARIFFDASLGHWWVDNNSSHRILNVISVAPTLRYYLVQTHDLSPFMDVSIGLAYLSSTYFDCRNLGMHFAFQDQVGLGVTMGKSQKLSMSLSVMHYSNGSIGRMNAGITIPLLLNVGYQF